MSYQSVYAQSYPQEFEKAVKEFTRSSRALALWERSVEYVREHEQLSGDIEHYLRYHKAWSSEVGPLLVLARHAGRLDDAPGSIIRDLLAALREVRHIAAPELYSLPELQEIAVNLVTAVLVLDPLKRHERVRERIYRVASVAALATGASAIISLAGGVDLIHPSVSIPSFVAAFTCVILARMFRPKTHDAGGG